MNNELPKWEYRVQTIGSIFGTKEEGWETTHVYTSEESGKVTIVAKRPLTRETIRRRSMPSI